MLCLRSVLAGGEPFAQGRLKRALSKVKPPRPRRNAKTNKVKAARISGLQKKLDVNTSRPAYRHHEPGSILLRQVQVIDQSLGAVDGRLGAFERGGGYNSV